MSVDNPKKRGRPPASPLSREFQKKVARELIGEILQQTGASQLDLELRYGLSEGSISGIVTGKRTMSQKMLKLILNNYVRDKAVPIGLKLVTAGIPNRLAIQTQLVVEKRVYEREAEIRRKNFEIEETRLREELELKKRDFELNENRLQEEFDQKMREWQRKLHR